MFLLFAGLLIRSIKWPSQV